MIPKELLVLLGLGIAAWIVLSLPNSRNWLEGLLGSQSDEDTALPYKSRKYLLTRNEAAFYHSLRTALNGAFVVSMKVRLSDILASSGGASFANRISQKHVDFVLCERDTLEIVAAIELDDRTHQRSDRQERDRFVDGAFEAAGLPLLRVTAARQYNVEDLNRLVRNSIITVSDDPEHSSS